MESAYFGMLEECATATEVRVIVVTGAGRGFCAGADMQQLQAIGDGSIQETADTRERRRSLTPAQRRSQRASLGATTGYGIRCVLENMPFCRHFPSGANGVRTALDRASRAHALPSR